MTLLIGGGASSSVDVRRRARISVPFSPALSPPLSLSVAPSLAHTHTHTIIAATTKTLTASVMRPNAPMMVTAVVMDSLRGGGGGAWWASLSLFLSCVGVMEGVSVAAL